MAWSAPLMRAGLLPFFGTSEISILSGLASLWRSDPALAALVALFAVVAPYAKTLAIAAMRARRLSPRALPVVKFFGRLSMADVFLVALYIVTVKGVGLGHVETAWGLWLFTGCVLTSLFVSQFSIRAH